jgi:integrase
VAIRTGSISGLVVLDSDGDDGHESLRRLEAENARCRSAQPTRPPTQEAARLLAAVPERDRGVWATAIYAGLRRGEIMALRWADVDLKAGTIHVAHSWDPEHGSGDTKNRNRRRVPHRGRYARAPTYLAASAR